MPKYIATVLLLTLMSVSNSGSTQPDSVEDNPGSERSSSSTTQQGTGRLEDAAEDAGDVPEATKDSAQSPFDYEASEEISEDRSVAFPVDI